MSALLVLVKTGMVFGLLAAVLFVLKKTDGLGGVQPARFADTVTQVSGAFEVKNPVTPEAVFNGSLLPPKADRMVFPK